MLDRDTTHNTVPINNLAPNEADTEIQNLINTGASAHVVTLTIAMYMSGRFDASFNQVLNRADLVIPESTGLMLYSKLKGPRMMRTPGGDLARRTVSYCAETGRKVALVGASPDHRRLAANVLRTELPTLDIDVIPGEYQYNNKTDSQWVCEKLEEMSPSFTVVAGTGVKAVEWIDENIVQTGVNTGVVGNFGQTIDVWAGKRYSPPLWAREHGIGWLMRLPFESAPKRKRYMSELAKFGAMITKDLLQKSD